MPIAYNVFITNNDRRCVEEKEKEYLDMINKMNKIVFGVTVSLRTIYLEDDVHHVLEKKDFFRQGEQDTFLE